MLRCSFFVAARGPRRGARSVSAGWLRPATSNSHTSIQERGVFLKTLLQLQKIDLEIEALKNRETEIPKQKGKFQIHKKRLAAELEESEARHKRLGIEQHECEVDIDQRQAQIGKYETQLLAVKKNEEYQALLHEIDALKKQIGIKEERVITIMVETDEAKAHLEEDKKRIEDELKELDEECAKIDAELETTVVERKGLEEQRKPLLPDINAGLLLIYRRIRKSKKTGAAVVPLQNESCSGCYMMVTAQVINELMGGEHTHTCPHCGRLLYHADNYKKPAEIVEGGQAFPTD
jgi:predicted  nucleic acid-binding Zn-ribbon protein